MEHMEHEVREARAFGRLEAVALGRGADANGGYSRERRERANAGKSDDVDGFQMVNDLGTTFGTENEPLTAD